MRRNGLTKSECLAVLVTISILALLLWPAIQQSPRGEGKYHDTRRSLKQIGLAMHNYESDFGRFPDVAIRDESGKALLSWRVLLLPYLGEQELYEQFDLTQPWDSEQNKKLIPLMPDVYQNVFVENKTYKTNMLLPVSIGLTESQSTLFAEGRGRKLEEVTDGTSTTIMLVTVKDELNVTWTKPGDWPFNPEEPLHGLQTGEWEGFISVFSDGSTWVILWEEGEENVRARFTCAGGEVVEEYFSE